MIIANGCQHSGQARHNCIEAHQSCKLDPTNPSVDHFQYHAQGRKGQVVLGRFPCAMSQLSCTQSDWLWANLDAGYEIRIWENIWHVGRSMGNTMGVYTKYIIKSTSSHARIWESSTASCLFLPPSLLLMLYTHNNTDGNKLVIFPVLVCTMVRTL